MRIISGSARGRKLFSPEGMDVRPTTDKVKESLFNILQFELEGAAVLDLFAGTGQLGLEALSRGAAKAVFVDSSKKSLATVKRNVDLCGFGGRSVLVSASRPCAARMARAEETFDIALLDPPYHNGLCEKAFRLLPAVLSENAIVVCETCSDESLPGCFGDFTLARAYHYSAVMLSVYRRGPVED